MKNITKNVISGLLVVVSSAFAFFTGFVTGETKGKIVQETAQVVKPVEEVVELEENKGASIIIQPQESDNIVFSSAEVAVADYAVMGVSETAVAANTLTATVIPETATNKLVDWSINWADSAITEDVTDYVNIISPSDGSTTITVECYKGFTNDIVVTVTTRESGFSAFCFVDFEGKPTDITISSTVSPNSSGFYSLGVGTTYDFDIGLSNPFGIVGETYNDIDVELSAVGFIILCDWEYYVGSGNSAWVGEESIVSLSSLRSSFFHISYENGILTLKTIRSVESYYQIMASADAGHTKYYYDKFYSYGSSDCYFTVTITENISGLSKVLKIRLDSSIVTGVSMSNTVITF